MQERNGVVDGVRQGQVCWLLNVSRASRTWLRVLLVVSGSVQQTQAANTCFTGPTARYTKPATHLQQAIPNFPWSSWPQPVRHGA